MRSLRKKLIVGFVVLLGVVLFVSFKSISIIQELGQSIDVILKENYKSVVACQNMKESLERIDSGMVYSMLGDRDRGRKMSLENEKRFEEALQKELGNITLPGEGKKANRLKELYLKYQESVEKNFNPDLPIGQKRQAYFQILLPLFQTIKGTAEDILQMNQQNMVDAKTSAYQKAARAKKHMMWLVLVIVLGAAGSLAMATKWIILPLQRLTHLAKEIEKGNFDLVVQVPTRDDEMGQLADAFNSMTERLREYRRGDQAKLERVQQATQRAIESLPDAIAVISPEGMIDIANQAAVNLFGLTPGKTSHDIQKGWLTDIIGKSRAGQTYHPENYEKTIQVFDEGQEKFFLPQAVPIWDRAHQLVGILLVLTNVTGLRKMDEAKSGLISTVSHELKTPLTSIRMGLHLLLEEKLSPLSAEQADLLVSMREDSDRLYRTIENILDISKIESGKIQMKLEKMLPLSVVQTATAQMETAFQDKRIDLAVEVPPELPDVWADPSRIHLVLTNLLSNALRFTPIGGKVYVRAAEEGDRILFSVKDNGAGIPQQYRARIFEKFFRVPGQKSETGAGLGLAIAKEVVEAHGGGIRLDSKEGKGSTFYFTLPRADKTGVKNG